MKLLSSEALEKCIQSILLNAYSIEQVDFHQGKAGIAITLFEIARFSQDELVEEHAFSLLQECLATETENEEIKLSIGYCLNYLIKNKFLDADYVELYSEQQNDIIDYIINQEYNINNCYNYANQLFYISFLSDHISKDTLKRSLEVIKNNILMVLNDLEQEVDLKKSIYFYKYASKLLSICNAIYIPNEIIFQFINRIEAIDNCFKMVDCINEDALYPINLFIYKRKYAKGYEANLKKQMNDIIIATLDFKQKVDLVFNIYKLYHLDHKNDYRHIANQILEMIIDKDTYKLEKKLYTNLYNKPKECISLSSGLSRLLLLSIYWSDIYEGTVPLQLIELLN